METTFYEDQGMFGSSSSTSTAKECIKNMKKRLTLDFNSPQPAAKRNKVSALLSSPDLNMLKLASPELENLIIQQNNGLVTTTPTPTQFIFPKNVTQEQENYARGFVDALNELHTTNSASSNSSSSSLPDLQVSTGGPTMVTSYDSISGAGAGTSLFSAASFPPPSSPSDGGSGSLLPLQIKEEPQTVPSLGATPPLSPIDMESQERIKLERKRQRNRIAASKCRKRKLERIAKLEDRVKNLKGENGQLGGELNLLRDEVCLLKQQVMDHVSRGCEILSTPEDDHY